MITQSCTLVYYYFFAFSNFFSPKIPVDNCIKICDNNINPISYTYSARHGVRNDRVRLKTDVPPIAERRKT